MVCYREGGREGGSEIGRVDLMKEREQRSEVGWGRDREFSIVIQGKGLFMAGTRPVGCCKFPTLGDHMKSSSVADWTALISLDAHKLSSQE